MMNDKEKFANNPSFIIHRISHTIKQINNKELEKYGLTGQQGRIIGYLWFNRDRDINQKDIEQEIGIKGSSVTSLIQNLEKQGFITRVRDKKDARNKFLVLTKKGISLHEVLFKQINKIEAQLLKDMDEDQKKAFLMGLQTALKNIEE